MPISRPSVASLLLTPEVNGMPLATATGFLIKRDETLHLATNRHVVTGRHALTSQPLHTSGAVPDSIGILHNVKDKLGSWERKVERLYDADEPRWREHPIHGDKVDVICLPLEHTEGIDVFPYDPWNPGMATLAADIGTFVNIIGFPFGIVGGGALAVWMKGAIATEPDVDWDGLPRFLIDSRTRPGQSGSPVIAYAFGIYPLSAAEGGGMQMGRGPAERFLGIYSGRVHEESDLGVVWKASLLQEILEPD